MGIWASSIACTFCSTSTPDELTGHSCNTPNSSSPDTAYNVYRPLTEVWICCPGDSSLRRLPTAFIEGLRTVLYHFNREMEQLRTVDKPSALDSHPNYTTEA